MSSDSAFERVASEIHRQYGEGRTVDESDYRRRYPQFRSQLDELFEIDRLLRPRAAAIRAGTIVAGDFRIVREIGRGGMGQVFEADQLSLRRRVALKVLRTALVSGRRVERFRREAESAAQLKHPHIVPIHAFGEDEALDVAFIAMDLVEGSTLAHVIRRLRELRRFALSESDVMASVDGSDSTTASPREDYFRTAARWVAQVAEALAVAHANGVVHRDVKPANILVRRDGVPVLSDFGLAHLEGDVELTRTGDLLGSPSYMSPEQIRGDAVDARTDVYSLGVTLYEFLALEVPFEAESNAALHRKILEEAPPSLRRRNPRLPRELETITLKALEKEPRHRFAGAADMAADLRRFLRGEPIVARPVGPLVTTLKLVRRNRLPVAIALAAVAAIATLAGLWVASGAPRRAAVARALAEARLALAAGDVAAATGPVGTLATLDPASPELDAMARSIVDLTTRSIDAYHEEWMKNVSFDEDVANRKFDLEDGRLNARQTELLHADESRQKHDRTDQGNHWTQIQSAFALAGSILRGSEDLRQARLRLLLERWLEADARHDAAEMSVSEDALKAAWAADDWEDSSFARTIHKPGSLTVSANVPGIHVYVFRYEIQQSLFEGGQQRLVPVPWNEHTGCIVAKPSPHGPIHPGRVCLVVESVDRGSAAERAGIEPGDFITEVDGRSVEAAQFFADVRGGSSLSKAGIETFDQLVSIDGEWRADVAMLSDATRRSLQGIPVCVGVDCNGWRKEFVSRREDLCIACSVVNAEFVIDRAWSANGRRMLVEVHDPSDAREPRSVWLPAGRDSGLCVWTTSCPLVVSAEADAGEAPLSCDSIPSGSYLLVARARGFEDLRYPVVIERGEARHVDLEPNLLGTTPPGFVTLPRFEAQLGGDRGAQRSHRPRRVVVGPITIARDETTQCEYLEFLATREGRRWLDRIAALGDSVLPRGSDHEASMSLEEYLGHSEGLTSTLFQGAAGLGWHDAQAYAESKGAGGREPQGRYRTPSEDEWEAAGRGADGRLFPWGDTFDWQFTDGWHSIALGRTGGFHILGAYPVDESPFGVRDLAGGGCVEWCFAEDRDAPPLLRGGSGKHDLVSQFHLASRIPKGPGQVFEGTAGFRLCLERR
jgi:serine/threonine protein kinase/formylglycine-generating enzyme required for sulfatase activity